MSLFAFWISSNFGVRIKDPVCTGIPMNQVLEFGPRLSQIPPSSIVSFINILYVLKICLECLENVIMSAIPQLWSIVHKSE